MAILRNIDTGEEYVVPDDVFYARGCWHVGDQRFLDVNGDVYELIPPSGADQLAAAKAGRIAEINRVCDQVLAPMEAAYPEREVASWPHQVMQAQAVLADPNAAAPLLRAMVAQRPSLGETEAERLAVLAGRILANEQGWSLAAGAVIGRRQELEKLVEAAEDLEAVAAVVIDLALPGAA